MSVLAALLWLSAHLTEPATLRKSCGVDEEAIRELPAGAEVTIRFAVTASLSCYKVDTVVDGRTLTGYLPARIVSSQFERDRQSAVSLGASQIETFKAAIKPGHGQGPLQKAWDLVQANQPKQALELIEPLLKHYSSRPDAFALAGLAAYQADQPKRAVQYWDQSLALKADPQVERLRERARREIAHDTSQDKLHGLGVVLRYEGGVLPPVVANQMVNVLDEELQRISLALGCRPDERITAVVQTPQAYRASTQAAEWTGGLFDGRIHVALLEGNQLGPLTRQTFAHELVHACLASLGAWPAWLHEGLAQQHSGERLDPARRAEVQQAISAGEFPLLENLARDWASLDARRARLAYGLAFVAAEKLAQHPLGVRNLLRNRELLDRVTRDLDRDLGLLKQP